MSILGVLTLTIVSGCATTPQRFDDTDVHFKLVYHQSRDGIDVYRIEVKSTSPLELTHLTMYLSYPLKIQNGHTSNPFAIASQNNQQLVNLKNGQSTQFSFYAPIKEVFGNSTLLDFKDPEIELNGYTQEGNKETPFGMMGDLVVFLKSHK